MQNVEVHFLYLHICKKQKYEMHVHKKIFFNQIINLSKSLHVHLRQESEKKKSHYKYFKE